MVKSIEKTGNTRDQAIETALQELGMQRDDVSVEVLDMGKKGFLGIGATPARVRVSYEVPDEPKKPTAPQKDHRREVPAAPRTAPVQKPMRAPEPAQSVTQSDATAEKAAAPRSPQRERQERAPRSEPRPHRDERAPRGATSAPRVREIVPVSEQAMQQAQQIAIEFISGLLQKMGVESEISVLPQIEADQLRLTITGPDMGPVIGRRGDTLDAIQYLTSLVLNNAIEEHVRISVDTENYREKRAESLERLARKVAMKVQRTHRSMTLEPMNPYERRIIHAALQEFNGITTFSTGTEPGRRVVIAPDSGRQPHY